MPDRNDLAYWFPILETAGVPVPRTEIVMTGIDLSPLLDGETPMGFEAFLDSLRAACDRITYPCFLRTGHMSGKHDWTRTCFLAFPEDLASHVAELVELSALVDMLGLPTDTWVAREFLTLATGFQAFRGMPVAVERRWFFRDGDILCSHPYWPMDSIENPSVADYRAKLLAMQSVQVSALPAMREIVQKVARAFEGSWSVDLALGADGTWYAIDMAEGGRSFHWPGCPYETGV